MGNPGLTFEELLVQEIHETPKKYWPHLLQLVRLFRESVTFPFGFMPCTLTLRTSSWQIMR